MTISPKTTIKTFFQTGDYPTQQNFSDFIDSCLFLGEPTLQTVSGNINFAGGIQVSGNTLGNAAYLNTSTIIINNTSGGLGLANTTVSAGTYTNPTLVVDPTGRLTSATSNAVVTTHSKTGAFTYDVSTASGTQAITGVGFTPKSLSFIAVFTTGGVAGSSCWGCDDGSSPRCITNLGATYSPQFDGSNSIDIINSGGNAATAKITAFGADGFTLTWTKVGSPTGTITIIYQAFG